MIPNAVISLHLTVGEETVSVADRCGLYRRLYGSGARCAIR